MIVCEAETGDPPIAHRTPNSSNPATATALQWAALGLRILKKPVKPKTLRQTELVMVISRESALSQAEPGLAEIMSMHAISATPWLNAEAPNHPSGRLRLFPFLLKHTKASTKNEHPAMKWMKSFCAANQGSIMLQPSAAVPCRTWSVRPAAPAMPNSLDAAFSFLQQFSLNIKLKSYWPWHFVFLRSFASSFPRIERLAISQSSNSVAHDGSGENVFTEIHWMDIVDLLLALDKKWCSSIHYPQKKEIKVHRTVGLMTPWLSVEAACNLRAASWSMC
jgi:hypothetical protein